MARAFSQPPASNDILFKVFYVEIQRLVGQRRSSWVLTTQPWEDVSSELTTRVWQKIHLYDQSKPFDRWCNTVISNGIRNLLRDNLYKYAKPCISAGPSGGQCVYNKGEDQCSWTKSGLQCAQCPIYAAWLKKKAFKHNVNATLPLEHHVDEVYAKSCDSIDIEGCKAVIDAHIMDQLGSEEALIYKLLFIKHWPLKKIGKKMGYKPQGANQIPGYQRLTKLQTRFKKMAREVIEKENLA